MKTHKVKWALAFLLVPIIIWSGLKAYPVYFLWKNQLEIHPLKAQVSEPTEISALLNELTLASIQGVQEITVLNTRESPNSIVALAESPSRNSLLIVHSNGLFQRWDIASRKLLSETNIGTTNDKRRNFNRDGSLLVTTGVNASVGFRIFNTETGEVVDCKNAPDCPKNNSYDQPGQLLSPNGKLLVYYGRTFYFQRKFDWDNQSDTGSTAASNDCLFRVGFNDFRSTLEISMVTISPSQDYIAYVLENGVTCVREMSEITSIDQNTGNYISKPTQSFHRLRFDLPEYGFNFSKLEFDPTNRWLAALTKKALIVWDLSKFFFSEKINIPVLNGNTFSFNQTGDLLALGTKKGITIFSVPDGKQIAEYETSQVTAMYFTRDNRLLVWGDAEGNVHLWGVPKE